MKRTNIHLEDDQREWLKTAGAVYDMTPAAVVRWAIDELRAELADDMEHKLSGEGRKPAAKGG